MSERRLKVLLLAESSNPESSSVSLIGWSLAQALARQVDVHVVTRVENAPALERAGWREGREFTTIDVSAVGGPVSRAEAAIRRLTGLGWTFTTALSAITYASFERAVWRRFGDSIRSGAFDVVHRITPVSPVLPSSIAVRCSKAGVPFVLGPINGGLAWPKEFRGAMWREGEWLSYFRGLRRLLPGYRATRRAASAILAGAAPVVKDLRAYAARCVYLPENAVDPERISAAPRTSRGGPLRIVFVGRLVPYKCADILVEAAASLVRRGAMTLDIVGDGPEMENLRRQIEREGISHAVELSGWLHDQREVGPRLARADALGFPSVREFGGGVVLEAMSLGVAPIVVDYGGPGELVTDSTGFKIPLGPRASIVAGLRLVFEALAADPSLARWKGERARERVARHFTWDAKATQIRQVYLWTLGRGPRPSFPMPFPDEGFGPHGAPLEIGSAGAA